MATGVGFSFDTSFLQNLEKADKKMEALMDKSNTLASSVTSAFQKMSSSGVIPFVNELENKLQALNSIKMSIGDDAEEQFKTLKDSASSAIDEINKLLSTLYKSKGYKNEVGLALDQTLDKEQYELWLMRKHSEAKEHKRIEDEKTQATIDAINKQNAAYAKQQRESDIDEKRYNDWLKQKEREVQDHEDAERRKHNATMNVIAQQNAAYAKQAELVKQKQREYAKLYAGLSPDNIKYLSSTSLGINPQIEFEQKQIKALTQAKFDLDKQDKNYVQTINRLDDAIARHKRNLQAITEAVREQQREYEKNAQANRQSQRQKNTNYEGALDFSSRAKSINREKLAIQYLTEARNNLSKADADYQNKLNTLNARIKQHNKNIQEATAGAKELQEKHRGLMDTSGQLARAMAAVFSVSAIKGYVNKLMQIRGEFELQQRSLQILLQNKDEANALWDKTVALAVKSPYTTKQLVTATKQLAAYRIESEKLYETNKMLADVSIGLGVEINRLILAFGQVKAANFLRGTELRQFSEAGVNMLDELAKRFTALEGRAVSVGEVFERVSKRMVSFADVEAVFKTITSEGGTFYQMQEKQSETLKGMMLNLKDSYELMINDIGKSNEGMLKGFVSMMKSIVDNWRDLAPFINTAGVALITYFGTGVLKGIAKYSAMILNIWKAHPFLAVASVLATVVTYIISAKNAVDELTAAMREVEKNVTESLEESIGLYRKLTDTINDSTASIDERNKAYEELKTKFKDILPDQLTELKYIESLSFNYKAAEDAMFSYYNAKAIEQKKDKIEGIYEGDFDRDTKDLLEGYNTFIKESGRFTAEQQPILKRAVLRAVTTVVEDAKSGKIAAEYSKIVTELNKRIEEYSGVNFKMPFANDAGVRKVTKNIGEIITSLLGYKQALSDIEGLSFETEAQREAYNQQEAFKEEMDTATRYFKDLVALRQKIADNKIDLTTPDTKLNEEQLSKRTWYLNSIQNIYNALVKDVPQYANKIKELDKTLLDSANKGAYEYKLALGGIENELFNVFAENAKSLSSADEGARAMLENFAEGIKVEADSKLATPLMEAITSAFNKAINDKDLSQKGKDLLAKLLPDEKQSTGDVRKMVEALLTQYRDEVKKWENATTAGATSLPLVEYLNQFGDKKFKSAMGMYLGSDEEFNELQQKVIPVLEHIDRLLGGDPDKKGRSRDLVDERLRVIKEIYKAYKELNKTFDETTSKTGAMEKFGDAFYSAFGKTPEEMGYNLFTAEGVVDAYNKFISTLSKADDITKGNLAKGEFVMELQVEMQQKKDKDFQDEIERMFSGYELSIELEKLNIPRELAESLFDVDTFDLSDIRTKLEQELYRLQVAGGYEDQIKKIQDFLKKVSKMEQEEQEERLKRYAKFLTKGFNERINLKIKELRELELLEKDKEKLAPQQYEAAKKGIQDEYNSKILKQEWEEFEKSSQYLNMFDDIENSSNAALRSMLSHLESLKQSMIAAGLPASDLKEILNQIEKVEEELEERTPFATFGKDLGTAVGKIGEYIKARKEEKKLLKDIEDLRQKEKELSPQVAEEQDNAKNNPLYQKLLAAQAFLATLEEGTQEYEVQEKAVEALYKVVYPVTTEHQEITEQIDETNQELDDAQSKTKKWEKALKGVGNGMVKFGDHLKEVGSFIDDMANKWETAFGLSDKAKDDIETIAGVAQGAGDMAIGIGKAIANPADIGAYMQAASGLMGIFATFGQAHDKEKERQIEQEMKLVERLQKVYEDLEEQIKNTYDISELNSTTKAAQDNLLEQIAATERMIEAEEDKKKSDQTAIDGYRDQIDELKEKYKELEETRLQELGAFATDENKKSGAEAFLDAWMEAYKQTGDGLTGLNEQFDEFFEDSVKRQMLQKATSKYLDTLFNKYDTAISDWTEGELTDTELYEKLEGLKHDLPELNEALKKWAEAIGISTEFAGKDASMSGLSAGIQGITEDQADVLASYWNSVRGYTADTNAKVTELAAKLFSDDTTTNPMLSQLLTIAEQTRAIRDLFDSVVGHGNGGTHSGAYLKVAVG